MGLLVTFLFRHMKGLRGLVVLAMIITVLQVSCDIFGAFPLKFIPSKVQNVGNDPQCLFPFLGPIESWFDIPQIDPSLQPDPHFAPGMPPEAQCPVDPNDPRGRIVVVRHSTLGVIVFSIVMLILFGLLSALLAFVDLYLAACVGQRLTARLRNQLFAHLQGLALGWHGKQQKGDLVQRITGNIADIEKLVTDGLVDLLAGVLTLVGVVSVMLVLSVAYTLIALAVAPALFMMVLGYTTNIKVAAKKAAKATGQLAHVATEDINALILIKVFTREALEAVRFGTYVDKNKRARLRAGWLQAQFTPLVALLVILGTAAILGVGGYVASGYAFNIGPLSIAADSVDVGTLILFLTFLKLLYQPMRDLSKLATLASTAASGAERIQEVLDEAPERKEAALPGPYTGPQRFRGEITFENVVMGYLPGVPVLRGINLHISPGQKIGLVGLSGSGKTTLARLIPRFYAIQQGTIKIDGLDHRLYPLDVLRSNVSMVLQESVLFEGTIRENIAFGRPEASIEEIVAAAKQAYIHEEITSLPDGYDTHVSEQGGNVSGGQRQRLAIARAILRDAPILILDEPTANLDVEAEAEVMRALSMLMARRTVLTISHRLSTLGHVDEILVLQDGQIVERGTFKELKRLGGSFARLLEAQNRYNPDRAEDETSVRAASARGTSTITAQVVPTRALLEELHAHALAFRGRQLGQENTGAFSLVTRARFTDVPRRAARWPLAWPRGLAGRAAFLLIAALLIVVAAGYTLMARAARPGPCQTTLQGSTPVLCTIAVGKDPVAVQMDKSTHRAFVVNRGSNTVSVLNTTTGALLRTVRVGQAPAAVAVDRHTGHVFVVNQGSNTLSVLDSTTGALRRVVPVGRGPTAVLLSRSAGQGWVVNTAGNSISMLNTTTGAVRRTVPVGARPTAAIDDARTHRVFVANRASGTVSVLDATTGAVLRTVAVGKNPSAVAVNEARNRVFVANSGSGTVSVLNAKTGAVLRSVAVGQTPMTVAVDETYGQVFVANSGSGSISVLDATTGAVRRTIAVGSTPSAVAVDPTRHRVFVANTATGTVSVLDVKTGALLRSVAVGQSPTAVMMDRVGDRALVINPASNAVSLLGASVGWTSTGVGSQQRRPRLPYRGLRHRPASTASNAAGPTAIPSSPRVLLNPPAVHFGQQGAGTTSGVQTIHVVNVGATPLTVTGIDLAGADPGDFAETDACTGAPIAVYRGCTISVRFTPLTSGMRSATLVITDNAAGSPQNVPLSGHG